jgi:HTH-type transcriptional regulator/antitoxin HigA
VVLVPELPKTHIYGFTRWLTPQKALVQLSLRYKTDDMLWFTFFHEAAHILLHGKNEVFLEYRDGKNEKEVQADTWASNALIPEKEWSAFISGRLPPLTEADIRQFARDQNIAPGIVLGRLQHREKLVPPSRHNHLKHKVGIAWKGL